MIVNITVERLIWAVQNTAKDILKNAAEKTGAEKTVGVSIVLAMLGFGVLTVDAYLSAEYEPESAQVEATTEPVPYEAVLPFREKVTYRSSSEQFFDTLEIDPNALNYNIVYRSITPWRRLIRKYAARYGVDPDLVGAIVYAESMGRPNSVSHVGAQGLMQLMPETADFLGIDNAFDPEQNIRAGVKYLALLDRKYGEEHTLWAWNAGPGLVERNRLPGETKHFIKKVLTVKQMLKENEGVGENRT